MSVADGPARKARELGIEIGRLWLHLPTGAAGIHGFEPERYFGGPGSGGVFATEKPIHQGGRVRLVEEREGHSADDHGFGWAGVSTSDVQTMAEKLGWEICTRRRAAEVLVSLGYRLHPRRDERGQVYFHDCLWLDNTDDLTWHVRESSDGKRFVYERSVFVLRRLNPDGGYRPTVPALGAGVSLQKGLDA